MSPLDADKLRPFLDAHWSTARDLADAAAAAQDPMGPDPEVIGTLAFRLRALADGARTALQGSIATLGDSLAALATALSEGSIDPFGPAGGMLDAGARALEEAMVMLEAAEPTDDEELVSWAEKIDRLTSEQRGSVANASWGPWQPARPDREDDYFDEVEAHVDNLQAGLTDAGVGGASSELVDDMLRSSRIIHGESGQMGVAPIEQLARRLGDVLDAVRQGRASLDAEATTALATVADGLLAMLDQLRAKRKIEYPFESDLKLLAGLLESASPPSASMRLPAPAAAPPVSPPAAPPPKAADASARAPVEVWGPWEPAYPEMEDDYLEEVVSHIDNLQAGLVQLSSGATDAELINDLFRSSHSIKGQSGQMSVRPLERVAHRLEDVLSLVREGKLALSPSSTEVLLGVIDGLSSMLSQLRSKRSIEHPIGAELEAMDRILRGEAPQARGQEAEEPSASAPEVEERTPEAAAAPGAARGQPQREPARSQPEPAAKAEPAKSATQAKAQYLRVDFAKVDRTLNRVGDLFINKIRLNDAVSALNDLQFQVTKLQNVLGTVREGTSREVVLSRDHVLRLQEGLSSLQAEMERTTEHMGAAMSETDMISSDLRDQVMEMRMVPVDSILGRLGRVVFDALQKENRGSPAGHKRAKLEVVGSDAEIDKMIANMLEVPLVHIVRNAIAHGIEPAQERVVAGKPAEGIVRIVAGQQGSRFVIETTDDGRGMDPAVIGRVAMSKSLVTAEQLGQMSDKEVLGLVFKPGFTTAEQVDDLKGRGVGLDEVMDKIRAIKGTVEVDSHVGRGSRVTLSLPLTLAISTVVLGEVDGELLALPLSAVERVVRVDESEVESMGDAEVFTLLGQTVPLIRLDDVLGMDRPPSKRPDACYVAVLRSAERRIGLTLDRMRGQREVVIKSLGTMLREAPLIAGATLLGDQCVLILNPAEIAAMLGKAMARGPSSASRKTGRRRVLLVDDDSITRMALRRIFEQSGLEVHEASDGLEAMGAARAMTFALVSTDVVMPRMDGYALTRELRKLPGYEGVPILMITSKDQEVDRRAGFEAGVDHYVTKPFDRSTLLALVEEVVS